MIATVQTQASTRIAVTRPRRGVKADGFSVPDAAPGSVAAPSASAGVGGLLALQEEPPEAINRRALSGGRAVLDELGSLQREMLGEGQAGSAVVRIERLLSGLTSAADPGLAAVLRQVALRARIEMWRHRGG